MDERTLAVAYQGGETRELEVVGEVEEGVWAKNGWVECWTGEDKE